MTPAPGRAAIRRRAVWATLVAVAMAFVAAPAAPRNEDAAAPAAVGAVVLSAISVPVVAGGAVKRYEYAIVGVRVADVVKIQGQVCERRFELLDAFLAYLHGHAFSGGSAAEHAAAEHALLAIARSTLGPGVVVGLDAAWSGVVVPPSPAAFGRAADVVCK